MGCVILTSFCGVSVAISNLAQASTKTDSPTPYRTCHTTFGGPPGGSAYATLNWTNGLPRPGNAACVPDYRPEVVRSMFAGVEVWIVRSPADGSEVDRNLGTQAAETLHMVRAVLFERFEVRDDMLAGVRQASSHGC